MNKLLLGTLVVMILVGVVLLLACGPEEATPTPSEEAEVSRAPAAFADGAFPPPLSIREEHENPWQILDCLQCHKEGNTVATEIPHDEWTSNCRQCHVPEEQTAEY